MSERVTGSNKPLINNSNRDELDINSEKSRPNSIPSIESGSDNVKPQPNSATIPYSERVRQYYNRRLATRRTSPKPLTDVETIPKSPQGKPETEEGEDDRETVNVPYPGVDDGFFSGSNPGGNNPDVENIPLMPNHPDVQPPDVDEGKSGKDPDSDKDEPDIGRPHFPGGPRWPNYPDAPGSFPGTWPDIEGGMPETIPDINVYQHKKTLAQGMMDLALFSANANQLRYVIESFDRHPYYYPSLVLISFSLIFQVAVGIGLIWNAHYNVKDKKEICIANKVNNYTMIGIFLVTVINVFISAFGVANASETNP